MRLSGEIHNSTRLVLGKDFADKGAVADIASDKGVARIATKRSEILWVAGVSELVKIDDGCGFNIDPIENEVGPDETGTASDEDGVFHKGGSWLKVGRWKVKGEKFSGSKTGLFTLLLFTFIPYPLILFTVSYSYFSQAAKVAAMASFADTSGSRPISIGQSIARSGSFQTKARSVSGR